MTQTRHESADADVLSRAQGCLLGQLAGDALGSMVEFQTAEEIRQEYPDGVRELAAGGTWDTIAGQPTDDSEMALSLARMLAERGRYDSEETRKAYVFWLNSGPFDCGMTVKGGLRGRLNPDSQANGAMMRISPLGIFGANHDLGQVAEWARQDAALTHPHPVCQQANALFTMAIALTVRTGIGAGDLHERIGVWADEMDADDSLIAAVTGAMEAPPADYVHQQGWVLTAFRNALWQLSHARNLESPWWTRSCAEATPTPMQPFAGRFSAPCTVGMRFPPMDRMPDELPPCGRTSACAPSSPRMLLAGGRDGTGRALDFVRLVDLTAASTPAELGLYLLTYSEMVYT